MGGGVFGLGSNLNVQAASISLIAIVAFTVIFELATHRLDHHLEGSPYKEMVDKIYKGEQLSLERVKLMSTIRPWWNHLVSNFFQNSSKRTPSYPLPIPLPNTLLANILFPALANRKS